MGGVGKWGRWGQPNQKSVEEEHLPKLSRAKDVSEEHPQTRREASGFIKSLHCCKKLQLVLIHVLGLLLLRSCSEKDKMAMDFLIRNHGEPL